MTHALLALSELPIDTVPLARYLIGKVLVRRLPEGDAIGRIIETGEYVIGDAGHAYREITRRNRSLFLEHGHAHVYLACGNSYMHVGGPSGPIVRSLHHADQT
jgi:DNA-3-methyladenine glycosylase